MMEKGVTWSKNTPYWLPCWWMAVRQENDQLTQTQKSKCAFACRIIVILAVRQMLIYWSNLKFLSGMHISLQFLHHVPKTSFWADLWSDKWFFKSQIQGVRFLTFCWIIKDARAIFEKPMISGWSVPWPSDQKIRGLLFY